MDKFKVGDKVSWPVGSDVYTGTVAWAHKARLGVNPTGQPHKTPVVFTRRCVAPEVWKLKGYAFGTLRHGGEAYRDPSF